MTVLRPADAAELHDVLAGYRLWEEDRAFTVTPLVGGLTNNNYRVAVDADVWHRVRIGPISDLAELNRIRDRLRSADIDALVIRVGD